MPDHAGPFLDLTAIFRGLPTAYLVMTRDLVIAEANDAYLTLLGRDRAELIGQAVFTAFPPSEDSLDEQGRNPVEMSFLRVRDHRRLDPMPLQHYRVADPVTGQPVSRYWSLISAPILGSDGETEYVVQRVEDVTDYVVGREKGQSDPDGVWQRRVEDVEADLTARARELRLVVEARDAANQQLARMGEVALALTAAETLDDLESIVIGRGLTVLGADGGAVVSRAPDGGWRLTVSAALGEEVQSIYGLLPYDSPLPAIWSAREGQRLLLPTRASGLAFASVMSTVYEDTQRLGWAFLPLVVGDRCVGSLAVAWSNEHEFTAEELRLLDGFAAQLAQAVDRIEATGAQRTAALASQRFSETLQRSMLTPPPEPDHLHIVVRYQPALVQAQIGGDWYDAFTQPDGATMLVVGDVVGHDGAAAAHMGQLRGLIRTLAYDADGPPASILARAERVARGLAVDVLATVVLVRIERLPDIPGGTRTLRWTNAGHPPMVLLAADGSSELLEAAPDLLLGVDPDALRHDHTVELPDNSTLLLFTDGLIERRGESLDTGLARLQRVLADLGRAPMDQFCDTLLERMVAGGAEDDIALLGLRAYPEDEPRPAGTR